LSGSKFTSCCISAAMLPVHLLQASVTVLST
jgi:hypothetical protein